MLKVLDRGEDFRWFYIFFNSKGKCEMLWVGKKWDYLKVYIRNWLALLLPINLLNFLEIARFILKYSYPCALFWNCLKFENCEINAWILFLILELKFTFNAIVCWNVANYFLNIGNYTNRYFGLRNSLKICWKLGYHISWINGSLFHLKRMASWLLLDILPQFNSSLTKGHLKRICKQTNENVADIFIVSYFLIDGKWYMFQFHLKKDIDEVLKLIIPSYLEIGITRFEAPPLISH